MLKMDDPEITVGQRLTCIIRLWLSSWEILDSLIVGYLPRYYNSTDVCIQLTAPFDVQLAIQWPEHLAGPGTAACYTGRTDRCRVTGCSVILTKSTKTTASPPQCEKFRTRERQLGHTRLLSSSHYHTDLAIGCTESNRMT